MRLVSVLLFLLAVPPHIWGQNNVDQQLYHFLLLEQKGQFASAIPGLQSIADSGTLSRAEQGKAWTLLGIACKETGQFQQAQSAFEKAINLLEGDAQHQSDLANALDFSAELYQSIGQTQTAGKMWSRVLSIYEKQEDHRALMKTYAHLAANELEQKHSRAARALMVKAMAETTSSLSDDDRAFLCDTQGWIDEKTGHVPEAIGDYERALELWKKGHGEEHQYTGWRYLLLGNAYAANGEPDRGIMAMRQGLTILDHTAGSQSMRYLTGEIMYARVLHRYGRRTEAAQLKAEATQQIKEIYSNQCINCTVSVSSFR